MSNSDNRPMTTITGSRRVDAFIFFALLVLMFATSRRLAVYWRPPAKSSLAPAIEQPVDPTPIRE